MTPTILTEDIKAELYSNKENTVLFFSQQAGTLTKRRLQSDMLRYLFMEIDNCLESCLQNGQNTLLLGVRSNFEMFVLDQADKKRAANPGLKIHVILPYESYSSLKIEEWSETLKKADGFFYLSPKDYRNALRNYAKLLAKLSSRVYCYIPYSYLETSPIYLEAKRSDIPIINIKETIDQYDYGRPLPEMTKEQFRLFLSAVLQDQSVHIKLGQRQAVVDKIRELDYSHGISAYYRLKQHTEKLIKLDLECSVIVLKKLLE